MSPKKPAAQPDYESTTPSIVIAATDNVSAKKHKDAEQPIYLTRI
ncbi:MAG: hypothetical protein NWE92_04065 [Candidatus Bathyarchaeota archaeon]|nr:hypothetical protein [Candidatus Bathyarchaeota archaeon]